jgi:hypothetical protein
MRAPFWGKLIYRSLGCSDVCTPNKGKIKYIAKNAKIFKIRLTNCKNNANMEGLRRDYPG